MNFGEAIPIPLDTADGFTVGRDDLTPPGGIGLKNKSLILPVKFRTMKMGLYKMLLSKNFHF